MDLTDWSTHLNLQVLRSSMTSRAAPSGKEAVKVKRRSGSVGRKQTADIEELTSSGNKALQEGRPQEALRYFRDALKAAEQLQDSRVLRACSFNLGAAYVEVGRPRKGLDFLRHAQPGPKADRLPDLQFNLALAHDALGQSREAATYFLQAAQLYRSQGDGCSEGDACVEMSRCYSRTRDWALAAQGYLRAAESYRVANMLDYAATALSEAGSHMTQSDQCNQEDIIGVLSECLSLMGSITDPRTLGSQGCRGDQARCFSNLAFAFSRIGEEEEAAESLILALQGFRDTGDYLAQAQVCEVLAECYLVQRKQHKAVQLYKQALSALSHCQDSGGIQDQLVERLTATLQQSLTVGPQKPHPPAPHSLWPHRHSLPIGPHVRKSDITKSPGTAANQQPDAPETDAPGSQQEASETPEYMSIAPGQSSDQLNKRQRSELWLDRGNPRTDSNASLAQDSEAPPSSPGDIREQSSLVSSWRSQFCLLM
ncbi:tetratricopeptide repeat protein 24 isoform X3 [Astatotilapia calliptera]|uniref:tetratricopeptide repeat protein 24 isoform X3 n=1 Tax=Astatotilapia calliptera TaxID=8154 RepID=UPI000E42B9E9|nr:tetratricopeptide repeat protein 24 isoform X3 [Astatotilapia calliptera]